MGYFKELLNRPVERPPIDIAVIDRNHVYQQTLTMVVDKTKNNYAKYNVKYKGENGIKYYKGKNRKSKHIFCSLEGHPIFNIQEVHMGNVRKAIYIGKGRGKIVGKISSKNSPTKYSLMVKNLISNEEEYLEMNSDKNLVVCGIFYGKEKEGAPLICKIKRTPSKRRKCTIEMAAGIDNEFMGLAAFFSDMYDFRNKKVRNAKTGLLHNTGYYSDESSNDESSDEFDEDDDFNEYADYGYAHFYHDFGDYGICNNRGKCGVYRDSDNNN